MRLLVLESSGNLWGSERALLDLIDGLPHDRLELAVCCPPNRPLQPELERRKLRIFPTFGYALHKKGKLARLLAAIGLYRACIAFQPNAIYVNQAGATRIAGMVSRRLHIPVITHVRIFEDAAYLAALRPNPRWLHAMIAISESIENDIRQHAALSKIDIVRLYDAYAYYPQPICHDAGDARSTNRLACVGRLAPIKGQDVLVAALHLLSSRGHNLFCAFAGGGDPTFAQTLQSSAQSGAARKSIEWLGNIDSVAQLLKNTSFLICPSHREPLGRVIFEAWDFGCVPIVFAGSGGAAEVVSACGGGLLYHEQTDEALASTIQQGLALTQDQRNLLIHLGRTWMRANLCPRKYGQAMAKLFERTVYG
jgi:glycosyltransferase involved in cell wall biosynthesis